MSIFEGIRQFIKWWNRPKPPELAISGYTFSDSIVLAIYPTFYAQGKNARATTTQFWVETVKAFVPETHKLGVVIYGRQEKPDGFTIQDEVWQELLQHGYLEDCKDEELLRFFITTIRLDEYFYSDPETVSLLGWVIYEGDSQVFKEGVDFLRGEDVTPAKHSNSRFNDDILSVFVGPDDDPDLLLYTSQISYVEVCQKLLTVALKLGCVSKIHPLALYPHQATAEEKEEYARTYRKPLRQSDLH